MPTHRDMPPGWDAAAAKRREMIDQAEEQARTVRQGLRRLTAPSAAELQAADRARVATSVPPPS
jgi:hypothetical protein